MSIGFRNLARSMGQDAQQILTNVRAITLEQISAIDATESLNKALTLIPPAAKHLDELSTIATGAAFALGTNVKDTFDDILTGLGRASPKILDNLGIVINSAEAFKLYSREIGKGAKELNAEEKQIALLNYVLDKNIDRFGILASVAKPDPFQVLTATFTDLKIEIGNKLIPVISSLLDFLNRIILSDLEGWANKVVKALSLLVKLLAAAGASRYIVGPLISGFRNLNITLRANVATARTMSGALNLARTHTELKGATTEILKYGKAGVNANTIMQKFGLTHAQKVSPAFRMFRNQLKGASDEEIRMITTHSNLSDEIKKGSVEVQRAALIQGAGTKKLRINTTALAGAGAAAKRATGTISVLGETFHKLWSAMWPLLAVYAAIEVATWLWNRSTKEHREEVEKLNKAIEVTNDIIGDSNRAYTAAINTIPELIVQFDKYDKTQKLTIGSAIKLRNEITDIVKSFGKENEIQIDLNKTTDETASLMLHLGGTLETAADFADVAIDSFGDVEAALLGIAMGAFAARKELLDLGLQQQLAALQGKAVAAGAKGEVDIARELSSESWAILKKIGAVSFRIKKDRTDPGILGHPAQVPETEEIIKAIQLYKDLPAALAQGKVTQEEYLKVGQEIVDVVAKTGGAAGDTAELFQLFGNSVASVLSIKNLETADEFKQSLKELMENLREGLDTDGGGGKNKLDEFTKALNKYYESLDKFKRLFGAGYFLDARTAILDAAKLADDFAHIVVEAGMNIEDFGTEFKTKFIEILDSAGISIDDLAKEFGPLADEAKVLITMASNADEVSAAFDRLDKEGEDAINRMKEFGRGIDALNKTFENIVLINLGIADANDKVKESIRSILPELQAMTTSGEKDVRILNARYDELIDTVGTMRIILGGSAISVKTLYDTINKEGKTKFEIINELEYLIDKIDAFDDKVLEMARTGKWSKDVLDGMTKSTQRYFDVFKSLDMLDAYNNMLEQMGGWSETAENNIIALTLALEDLFSAKGLTEFLDAIKEIYAILEGIELPDTDTEAGEAEREIGLSIATEFFNAVKKLDFSSIFGDIADAIGLGLGQQAAKAITGAETVAALSATGNIYAMAVAAGVSLLGTALDKLFGREEKLEGQEPVDVRVINPIELKEPTATYRLAPVGATFSKDFRDGLVGGVII